MRPLVTDEIRHLQMNAAKKLALVLKRLAIRGAGGGNASLPSQRYTISSPA
jgi:hypothetical protein